MFIIFNFFIYTETRCPHAQEPEIPVDEVEDGGAYGDGSDVGPGKMPHNGHVHHAQQRYGDVGDDVGQCQPQDASIHLVGCCMRRS